MVSLASSLFRTDAQAAIAMVEGFPEGELRKEANKRLRQIAEREVDPARREAWLKRLK